MKTMFRKNFTKKLIACLTLLFFLNSDFTFADVGNGVSHNEPDSSNLSVDFSDDGINIWFLMYLLKENPYLAAIVVLVYFIYRRYGKSQQTKRASRAQTQTAPRVIEQPTPANLERLKARDPLFSDEVFLSKVNNMFIQLQQAWMDKQWNSIRPFETDALFNMHHKQLNAYIEQQRTNVVENIAILDSTIVRYEHDGAHDELAVMIRARLNDYVIDDHTKKIIKGNPNRDIYMTYIWTLIRKDTVLTKNDLEQYEVTQCPNCGANVSINASGQCEYCESIISSGDYDWVLSKIKVVNQR